MQRSIDQELGNYRLIRVLSEGGFAKVYLGEHIHLGTLAAIKIHHMRLEGTDLERFEREARTIGQLRHPHIVRVLDYGVQDGVAFLVMDYASRGTLRQLHPTGTTVPLETVVQYVKQVAAALQYAHDRKLVHRDVKPENILLDAQHNVLLSDFGIAVVVHSTRSLGTQDAIGTVSYMAPEQLRKKARPASDQYALATIAYEWLCGTPPFDGLPIEVALQHITDPIPPLRDRLPDLPRPVEQVLLRALAKDPEQRFPTIQAFADTLEKAAQVPSEDFIPQEEAPAAAHKEHPIEVPGPRSPARQFWPTRRKRDPAPRAKVLLRSALLLLVILGSVGTLGVYFASRNQVDNHRSQQASSIPTIQQTPLLTTGTSPITTGTSPGDWSEPGFDAQNTDNNTYEHTLNAQNVTRLMPLWQTHATHGPFVTRNIAFAVAHGMIYFSDGMSSLVAISTQTRNVLKTFPLPGAAFVSAYASTPAIVGDQLYLTSWKGDLLAINLRTGTSVYLGSFALRGGGINLPAPVAANGIVYAVSELNEIYAVDTQTNQFLWQTPLADVTTTPAVADGVVYVGGFQYLYALNARTGALLWQSQRESSGNTGQNDQYISGFFPPVVGPQYVYTTENRDILAYPRQCTTPCAPAWSFPTDYIFRSGPSFANGVVYAATGDWGPYDKLYALDGNTGKVLWSAETNVAVIMPPIIANDVLYLTNWNGDLEAFTANGCNASTCKPIWSSSLLDNAQYGRAVSRVVDAHLYTLTDTGKFIAFGLPGT